MAGMETQMGQSGLRTSGGGEWILGLEQLLLGREGTKRLADKQSQTPAFLLLSPDFLTFQ